MTVTIRSWGACMSETGILRFTADGHVAGLRESCVRSRTQHSVHRGHKKCLAQF